MKKADKPLFLITLIGTFAVILGLNLLTPMLADDYRYAYSFSTGTRLQGLSDIFPSLATHASVMLNAWYSGFLHKGGHFI